MRTLAESCVRIEYARYDPALGMASLFRPVYRGRRPGGLTIEHKHGGLRLKFNVWQALDTRDQSVLLAAIALAGILGTQDLHAGIDHSRAQQLWQNLKPEDLAVIDQAIVVRTTRYALLRAAGFAKKGQNYGLLEDCLERLSMVGCRARKDGYDWSMRLLSYTEAPDGKLHIALNPRFAQALSGQYVRVSLFERRQLSGDTAMLAHAWLSAWLRTGYSNSIRLDLLAEKVWGSPGEAAATNRKRRERITKALQEISQLKGWQVRIEGRGNNAKTILKRSQLIKQK
ncbi:replication protein C, IncQ-type [Litchfieldella xinjiangensis]|uniref:replication protein C, IncQ-type n=1 Tax=Litchfieldella xinjiangensis TaxID=1166948 RepID=UPI0005BC2EE6|nr:replication protein C, IncQ-type [Halomonas xinjiangensis]